VAADRHFIRHADTVDVKFVLVDENEGRTEKTIALQNADLITVARDTGRKIDDPGAAVWQRCICCAL